MLELVRWLGNALQKQGPESGPGLCISQPDGTGFFHGPERFPLALPTNASKVKSLDKVN